MSVVVKQYMFKTGTHRDIPWHFQCEFNALWYKVD